MISIIFSLFCANVTLFLLILALEGKYFTPSLHKSDTKPLKNTKL